MEYLDFSNELEKTMMSLWEKSGWATTSLSWTEFWVRLTNSVWETLLLSKIKLLFHQNVSSWRARSLSVLFQAISRWREQWPKVLMNGCFLWAPSSRRLMSRKGWTQQPCTFPTKPCFHHWPLLAPGNRAVRIFCLMRVFLHTWGLDPCCAKSAQTGYTLVPIYPWGSCSKSPSGCLKPRTALNSVWTVFSYTYMPMMKFNC